MGMKDTRAVGLLITSLKEEDTYVRETAAYALGNIKDTRAVGPLSAAMQDKDRDVRIAAAMALCEISASAIEPRMKVLEQEGLENVAWLHVSFLERGELGTERVLIKALKKYGTRGMAVHFMNCGNSQLESAGYGWASRHGYMIMGGQPGPASVYWGSK